MLHEESTQRQSFETWEQQQALHASAMSDLVWGREWQVRIVQVQQEP